MGLGKIKILHSRKSNIISTVILIFNSILVPPTEYISLNSEVAKISFSD